MHNHDWTKWTDTLTFLGWIRDAYLSAGWPPWETSNPGGQWGIQSSHITSALLLRHVWPDELDNHQFRVDLIRAQHKPSGRGWAEGAFQKIRNYKDDLNDLFNIH